MRMIKKIFVINKKKYLNIFSKMLKIKYNLTMNHLISSNIIIYPTQISTNQQHNTKYHVEGLKK